jgi:uncharacterized protein YbjT (DUF2867 family)
MNIAIIGASGFVGKNLTKYLLENTNYHINTISLDPTKIYIDEKYKNRTTKLKADVFNYNEIEKALNNIDVVYYLIHMMATNKNDFYEKEALAAHNTGKAIKKNNIKRVIYLSGLGNDKDKLSKHLASRHNTGDILRKYNNEVIELRASMIIGKGSISFEIIKNIVENAPVITLPKWSKTKTEPIGISDALLYLGESINLKIEKSEIIEIGGPEIMSYKEAIKRYAKFRNINKIIFRLPILPEKIAGLFLSLFTTKEQACVGKCMLSSFKNEMIVTNNKASILFPNIKPEIIEKSFV